jgi:hypothetical protein
VCSLAFSSIDCFLSSASFRNGIITRDPSDEQAGSFRYASSRTLPCSLFAQVALMITW